MMALLMVACSPTPTDTDSDSGGATDTDTTDDGRDPAFALCSDLGPSTVFGTGYEADIKPIFDICVDCHRTAITALRFEEAYAVLVDGPSEELPSMDYIEPGAPDGSYLWHKLCDTHREIGGSGTQMPQLATLTEDAMEVIRSWIVDGAAP